MSENISEIVSFENTYPSIQFNHLKKQTDFIESKNGRIYYIHTVTNQVFSLDTVNNIWQQEIDSKHLYVFFSGHRFYQNPKFIKN